MERTCKNHSIMREGGNDKEDDEVVDQIEFAKRAKEDRRRRKEGSPKRETAVMG